MDCSLSNPCIGLQLAHVLCNPSPNSLHQATNLMSCLCTLVMLSMMLKIGTPMRMNVIFVLPLLLDANGKVWRQMAKASEFPLFMAHTSLSTQRGSLWTGCEWAEA